MGEWFLASSCLAPTVLIWAPAVTLRTGRNVLTVVGSGHAHRSCSRRCATRDRVAAHRRARARPPR
ncbi:hypothetical protein ACWD0A_16050 [Streptomyces sp. NPDC002867]